MINQIVVGRLYKEAVRLGIPDSTEAWFFAGKEISNTKRSWSFKKSAYLVLNTLAYELGASFSYSGIGPYVHDSNAQSGEILAPEDVKTNIADILYLAKVVSGI